MIDYNNWRMIDAMINYLSNELITSKCSKCEKSANSILSANNYKSINADNYTNHTIKETTIENQKSAKKWRVMITADSLFNGMNGKQLSKDNSVNIKKFSKWNYRKQFRESWRATQEQARYTSCARWDQWFDERKKCVQ